MGREAARASLVLQEIIAELLKLKAEAELQGLESFAKDLDRALQEARTRLRALQLVG